ncbi:hypothetical protein [Streptomyces sp. SM12]|uniref:hypothetical protein n=1 Tax=Streptomyces sp. SM12 TaxID=1071602 RepID=UPI000CD54720|nr:hypothetical protein [Streptomyces sp. SM12]
MATVRVLETTLTIKGVEHTIRTEHVGPERTAQSAHTRNVKARLTELRGKPARAPYKNKYRDLRKGYRTPSALTPADVVTAYPGVAYEENYVPPVAPVIVEDAPLIAPDDAPSALGWLLEQIAA